MVLLPNTPENWRENARTLAWICQFSYFDDGPARTEFHKLEFTGFQAFSTGATQAMLAVRGDDVVLAFRGTEGNKLTQPAGLADIFDDSLVKQVPAHGGGMAHQGFQGALGRVWIAVRDAVAATGAPRLWLTGHSLGGALAVLAAVRFAVEVRRVPDGLFTFGQPRVGNADFAAAADSRLGAITHRCIHAEDIVARVPNVGYKHFGWPHFLARDGAISNRVPSLLELGLENALTFGFVHWTEKLHAGSPLIDDHMIWNYRAKLDA